MTSNYEETVLRENSRIIASFKDADEYTFPMPVTSTTSKKSETPKNIVHPMEPLGLGLLNVDFDIIRPEVDYTVIPDFDPSSRPNHPNRWSFASSTDSSDSAGFSPDSDALGALPDSYPRYPSHLKGHSQGQNRGRPQAHIRSRSMGYKKSIDDGRGVPSSFEEPVPVQNQKQSQSQRQRILIALCTLIYGILIAKLGGSSPSTTTSIATSSARYGPKPLYLPQVLGLRQAADAHTNGENQRTLGSFIRKHLGDFFVLISNTREAPRNRRRQCHLKPLILSRRSTSVSEKKKEAVVVKAKAVYPGLPMAIIGWVADEMRTKARHVLT